MRRFMLLAFLLIGAATADAQTPSDLSGRALDLIFGGRVVDLAFATQDLRYAVMDTGAKTAALNVHRDTHRACG